MSSDRLIGGEAATIVRIPGDHISSDGQHWVAWTTVLTTDRATGRRVLGWQQQFGGPRSSGLSRVGQALLLAGRIGEALPDLDVDTFSLADAEVRS